MRVALQNPILVIMIISAWMGVSVFVENVLLISHLQVQQMLVDKRMIKRLHQKEGRLHQREEILPKTTRLPVAKVTASVVLAKNAKAGNVSINPTSTIVNRIETAFQEKSVPITNVQHLQKNLVFESKAILAIPVQMHTLMTVVLREWLAQRSILVRDLVHLSLLEHVFLHVPKKTKNAQQVTAV